MVARITSGATPAGALYYNKDKIDRGEGRFLVAFNTPMQVTDERHFDIREALRCFEPYLEANRRTKNPVFHASLNPAPEDRLSNDELRQIAREYMERMGYGAQPCFVFLHEDIERRHIHIVSLRVGLDGRKLAHDFEARRSREILDALERRYGLRPAAEGDAKQTYDTLSKLDYTKSDLKRQLASLVRSTLHRYRCTSFGELRTLLEYFNVSIEECRGTAHGHEYAGILYGALDDDATPQGVPIKSSRIGRDVGHRTLERYYARSREALRDSAALDGTRQTVVRVLGAARSPEEFCRLLEAEGITVVLRRTDAGRIYGTTFIDHRAGVAVNGSRLGREFAANGLAAHFDAGQAEQRMQEAEEVQEQTQEIPQGGQPERRREYPPAQERGDTRRSTAVDGMGLEELFDLLAPADRRSTRSRSRASAGDVRNAVRSGEGWSRSQIFSKFGKASHKDERGIKTEKTNIPRGFFSYGGEFRADRIAISRSAGLSRAFY